MKKQTEVTETKTSALTPEEMAIYQRVKNESREWETITEESVDDYSLMQDPFKLPPEIKEYVIRKEFAFRWIERKSQRLDEIRAAEVPNKWWVVNTDSFPQLDEDLFDPILGCVSRLDQMLVFKPWWMHEKRMQMVESLNKAQDRSGTVEGKHGERRDGVQFIAGRRNPEQILDPIRSEIKAGDKIEYEEPLGQSQDLKDLIDE